MALLLLLLVMVVVVVVEKDCSKPHQWQEDERKVREGTCSFQVRVRAWLCCCCWWW